MSSSRSSSSKNTAAPEFPSACGTKSSTPEARKERYKRPLNTPPAVVSDVTNSKKKKAARSSRQKNLDHMLNDSFNGFTNSEDEDEDDGRSGLGNLTPLSAVSPATADSSVASTSRNDNDTTDEGKLMRPPSIRKAKQRFRRKERRRTKKLIERFEQRLDEEKEKVADLKCELDSTKKNYQLLARALKYNTQTSSIKQSKTCIATGPTLTSKSKTLRRKTSELLSGVPLFHEEDITRTENSSIGRGQFGSVSIVTLKKLNIAVACKSLSKETSSSSDILSEAIVGLTVSGEKYFPLVFGILNPDSILMEFFGNPETLEAAPNLYRTVKGLTKFSQLKPLFIDVLNAVITLHSFQILHNDLKADNFVCTVMCVKLIDFGKATHKSHPKAYNIFPGTEQAKKYNTFHRHLAYELRNIPGSKQSIQSDIFSLGHMFKHLSALVPCDEAIELGRSMKVNEPDFRIPLETALSVLIKMT